MTSLTFWRWLKMLARAVPETVRKAEELTPYALITRYPGLGRPVTLEEYEAAVAAAEAVVQWAKEQL